jgi:hypothetical protein
MSNLEELGLPTDEQKDNKQPVHIANRFSRRTKIIAGVGLAGVLLWSGLKVADDVTNNFSQYATDNCTDGNEYWQVDNVSFFSRANLARTVLQFDPYWNNPHTYEQLAGDLTSELRYKITADGISSKQENKVRSANPNAVYPTTATDSFHSPAVFCVALPGPTKTEEQPFPGELTFIEGPAPDFNDLSDVSHLLVKKDGKDMARVEALYLANSKFEIDAENDTPSIIRTEEVTLYDGKHIREVVTSLPGIENDNEAIARVAAAEEKLGLS